MKMNDTVARIVEIMFQDVEMNDETAAIRDEVMNNCQERYLDLVNSGMAEDDAIAAVVESLKGMEDVLAPYKKKVQHVSAEDELVGEKNVTFAADMVHAIEVRLVNEDVTIEASDDNEYHVIWNADENPLVDVELQGSVLHIDRLPDNSVKMKGDGRVEEHRKDDTSDFVRTEKGKIEIDLDGIEGMLKSVGNSLKNVFSNLHVKVGFGDSKVTIQVPENAVPHVKVHTTSGDIDVQDVALADLVITSVSGDINIDMNEPQNLNKVEIHTTSGDIDVSAFTQGMNVTSTSGDVELEGRMNDLAVSTISGDIDVRANVVNMTFKAISGDVDMRFDSDEIREVRGSTISGDIEIDLPEGIGAIAINTQTKSGDVITRHHTDGVGPTVNGSVSTMSGDITIR